MMHNKEPEAVKLKPMEQSYRQRRILLSYALIGLLLAGLLVGSANGFAQEETSLDADLAPVQLPQQTASPTVDLSAVATSRPSFTDAWTTVPYGSLQVESGATYTDNNDGTKVWTLPESLIRFGVTDNTELRFTVPNYIYNWEDSFSHNNGLVNNFGDISAGLSHHIALPGKIDLAIVPILNIPSGANKASSNSLDPQLRLSFGRAVTNKLTLGTQLDTRWNTGRNAAADVVLNATGIAYYAVTPKLSGFLEYSGFIPTSGKTLQFIQGGLLYLLTQRQQIDVRIAKGLNPQSPDFLVGFGYTFRVDGLLPRRQKP